MLMNTNTLFVLTVDVPQNTYQQVNPSLLSLYKITRAKLNKTNFVSKEIFCWRQSQQTERKFSSPCRGVCVSSVANTPLSTSLFSTSHIS